ncbi:hypothetical protein JCM5350_006804 [Sporobolomyces pararoseus]
MTLTSTSFEGGGELYLSIEAGVDKYRLAVLDEKLEVVWTEQVNLDLELPEFKTRNGVHTLGDRVTAPSEMRLKALDLLLEKLSVNTRQAQLIPRIVAISGSGQPGVLHFLNPQFESLLAVLDNSSSRRISEIINSSTAFTLEEPASSGDSSSMTQVRKLETHFGKLSLSSSSSTTSSSSSPSTSPLTVSYASASILTNQQHLQTLEEGREFFASKTGSRVLPQYSAAQLVKIREKDDESLENREIPSREGGVLGRTGRIVTESSLLSSIFSGKLVPIEASDAGSTNLFNPVEEDWEDEILDFVMKGIASRKYERSGEGLRGGARLRELLGEVQKDGTESIGTLSPYFVNRFGFSPDCLVVPFTNTDAASFLSFPLRTDSRPELASQRDALLSLTSSDTDSLFIPSPHFAPHPDRQFFVHPARYYSTKELREGGGSSRFVAMITSKDAGLARSLSRDLYCNGSWDVFTRLVAIVPHGGTLGLDGKQFSIFFPHGQGSFVQGFLRFVGGVKVPELPDRKSNPRLMIESQFISLRIRLSRLYSSLLSLEPHSVPLTSKVSPHDSLGFPKLSNEFLPTRIVLVGSASINPAMTSVLSTIFGAPAYLSHATGLKRSTVEGEDLVEYYRGKEKSLKERKKTSAAVLGAGYRATWIWSRESKGIVEVGSYENFLEEKLKAQDVFEAEGGGIHSIGSQAQFLPTQRIDDNSLEEQKYPISSVSSQFPPIPVTERSYQRRSSSIYTLASSSAQTHSRKSSIYSSATSLFSSAPVPSTTLDDAKTRSNGVGRREGGGGKGPGVRQKMYNPQGDDFPPVRLLGEDPAGLDLVAMPDEHEFKYYSSMMPEYVRLEKHALKGLI